MTLREKINHILNGLDDIHLLSDAAYREARDTAADSILAAVREAMLTDEVKSAAGWRLSRGALLPDEYRKDTDYKRATDDLALRVVEAAITAAGITESEVE